jgi:hypothetical protein
MLVANRNIRKTHVQKASFFNQFCIPSLLKRGFRPYLVGMSRFFFILMLGAMFLTFASLFMGLFAMVKGGEFNQKYGNRLMRARVTLQGIALALFALALITSQE